jgi:Tol biopolymer transport system component
LVNPTSSDITHFPFNGITALPVRSPLRYYSEMHASLRVVSQILLVGFCSALLAGCSEYNRIATISEANSLAHVVQLTDGFDRAGEAFSSRDFRWIVFRAVAAAGRPPQLYLAKLGSPDASGVFGIEKPICITPAGTRSVHGCFSPDGLSLIFASNADAPNDPVKRPINMRIFRADGWEGMIAMTDRSTGANLALHPMETGRGDSQDCSFSPDGKWIFFSNGEKGAANLFVMHADGSHIVQLTNRNNNDLAASVSPDGKSLVFQSERSSKQGAQIFLTDLIFDRDGEITGLGNENPLTHDEFNNTGPAWHPDGRHIIYSTSKNGRDNYELYLMDREGRHKTRLSFSPGADLMPIFSPDGKYILWTSARSKDGTAEVFAAQFMFPKGS